MRRRRRFPDTRLGIVRALLAISRRQRVFRQEVADRLAEILAMSVLPAEAADLVRYFLAECQRDLGYHQQSASGMRQVVAGGGPLAGDAARGLVHLSRRMGDFPAVLEASRTLLPGDRYHRVLGDLWWTQGAIALACSCYDEARRQADAEVPRRSRPDSGVPGVRELVPGSGPRQGTDPPTDLLLDGLHARWAETQNRIATLLHDAGSDPGLAERAASFEADAQASGLSSSVAYIRFTMCFHHAVSADADGLTGSRRRLRECVNGAEFAYLVEISHFLDLSEPPDDLPRAALDRRPGADAQPLGTARRRSEDGDPHAAAGAIRSVRTGLNRRNQPEHHNRTEL